jgi:hypothetical protein
MQVKLAGLYELSHENYEELLKSGFWFNYNKFKLKPDFGPKPQDHLAWRECTSNSPG